MLTKNSVLEKLKGFDGLHKNKRGFVIGGGPTLYEYKEQGFDFSLLENEITVAANVAYDLFKPTYLVWEDGFIPDNFSDEITGLEGCTKFCPSYIAKKYPNLASNPDVYVLHVLAGSSADVNVLPKTFSKPISFWNNTGVVALRLAYLLGLYPIYLLGIDLRKSLEGRTHFHDKYGKARHGRPKVSNYDGFYNAFKVTIEAIRREKVRVYSCSRISPLNEIIPYKDLRELF